MYQRDEEKIYSVLKEHYDALEEAGYNVFGTFLYGSQNTNLDDEKSDIDAQGVIILPFEEYEMKRHFTKRLNLRGELLDVQDLDLVMNTIYDCHFSYVELLCTKYYYINPKYKDAYERFKAQSNDLVAWSPQRLMLQCYKENEDTLQHMATQYILPNTPTIRVAKVAALFTLRKYFLEKYKETLSYWESCDLSEHREELIAIKRNTPFHSKQYWLDYTYSIYRELQTDIKKFCVGYVPQDNKDILVAFQNFIQEIMELSRQEI